MFTLGSGHACLSPWGVGQVAVSGERPREDGVCEVWELWFLQAEELVHSFGSVLQKSGPWVWKGGMGRVSALWCSWMACLGF